MALHPSYLSSTTDTKDVGEAEKYEKLKFFRSETFTISLRFQILFQIREISLI